MKSLLLALVFAFTFLNVFAQGDMIGRKVEILYNHKWYPGSILEFSGGSFKVHYDGYPESADQWVTLEQIRTSKSATPGKAAPVVPGEKGNIPVQPQAQTNTTNTNTTNTTTCSFNPPGPRVTKEDKFSQQLFKRKVYDHYNMFANGTLSAPLQVGVTFLSYKVGTPYTNTVSNVPGYGAKRKHDGAPPYIQIYPLHSVHIVCEKYNSGIDSRKIESDYDCFISRDGEWTCPGSGKLVITKL